MKKIVNTLWLNQLAEWLGRRLDSIVQWFPLILLLLVAFWCGGQLVAWFAPALHRYRPVSFPSLLADGATIVDAHWFGVPSAEPVSEVLAVNVLGVYAPVHDASGGFAIIQEGAHPRLLLPGQPLSGGWRLAQVTASGITVRSGLRDQFVPLVSRDRHSLPVGDRNAESLSRLLPPPDEPLLPEMTPQK